MRCETVRKTPFIETFECFVFDNRDGRTQQSHENSVDILFHICDHHNTTVVSQPAGQYSITSLFSSIRSSLSLSLSSPETINQSGPGSDNVTVSLTIQYINATIRMSERMNNRSIIQ